MGTNAAPKIANLTLYYDEATYIDQLIQQQDIQSARAHAHTRRYIDDLLLWNTTPPHQDIYGLQYSETYEPDNSITFLGAKITTLPNNNTAAWDFSVIRYTHGESNVPPHQ